MKDALRSALTRDPVDVANDATFPCTLLDKRADATMEAGRAAVAAIAPQAERQTDDKPGCVGLEGQGFALLAEPTSLRVARAVLPVSFLVSLLLAGSIFSFPVFLSLPGFLQPLKFCWANRPAPRADRAAPGSRIRAYPLRGLLRSLVHSFRLRPPGAGLLA